MSRRNAMRDYTTADILNTPIARGGILPLTEYADRSEFDLTSGLPGAFYDALTAPARAYRGELSDDQQIPEAFNFAGSLTLGSLLAPRPTGSVGMGGRSKAMQDQLDALAEFENWRKANPAQPAADDAAALGQALTAPEQPPPIPRGRNAMQDQLAALDDLIANFAKDKSRDREVY